MAMMTLLIVKSFFLFSTVAIVQGYFEIIFQRCQQTSNDSSLVDFTNIKVQRVPGHKDRALTGNVTFHVPLDDSYDVDIIAFKKSTRGDYQLRPYRVPKQKLCLIYRDDIYFMPEAIDASNLPSQGTCPIPAVRTEKD
jgi:hypothetical protein